MKFSTKLKKAIGDNWEELFDKEYKLKVGDKIIFDDKSDFKTVAYVNENENNLYINLTIGELKEM
jgi:hypothetical protein